MADYKLDPYERIALVLYSNGEKSIRNFVRELDEEILLKHFEWAFKEEEDE